MTGHSPTFPPAADAAPGRDRFSHESLCRAMLARHPDTIRTRKPSVAVPRLERIVTAVLEISNRKGFQAMGLRELSAASGLSMGALYGYFDSKETLLRMILAEVAAAADETLGAAPEAVRADPQAHLMWLIEAHLRMTEAMLPWFTFAFMEAKTFPQAERRMAVASEERSEAWFAEVVARGIATGAFHPQTPALLPSLIKPLLQDWYVKRAKYRRRNVSLPAYVTAVQTMALAACSAPVAPPRG